MKKILVLLAAATLFGAGGLAVASATNSPAGSTSTTTAAPATGTGGAKHGASRAELRKLAVKTAADAIGLSPAELLEAMRGDHSIADVARSHHVDVQKVVDAVVNAFKARIKQAVAGGRITSEQAAKLEAAVAGRVEKLVNATPEQLRRRRFVRPSMQVSAKAIGITLDELRKAIASGKSVSDVATAHHVDPTTVVNALVKAGEARIDKAVASHHLEPARAAKVKARLPELAQHFVDFTRDSAKQPAAAA